MILRDVRLAIRSLRRAPVFTVLTVLTLAIGIGPTTAIFSIVDSLLLRPLPYRDAESLVIVWRARQPGDRAPMSGPDYADFRRMATSYEEMAVATWTGNFNVGDVTEPIRVDGARVTPNFFKLLGAPPLLGALPAGNPVGGDNLAILGETLWRRSYGARRDVIGTTTRLNGQPHRIVAVMPHDFAFPEKSEVWVPFDLTEENLGHRALHQYRVLGRLKPGVTPAAANEEAHALAKRLGAMYPDTTAGIDAWTDTLRDSVAGSVRKPLLVLFGAVAFLLLIACSNAANLLLTRAVARAREVAVRKALGATRTRLARELLTETILLTTAGAVLGLGLAWVGLRWARALGESYFPRPDLITIDGRVLAFNFLVAAVTGLAFGLAPLLSRGSDFEYLKSGARADARPGWSSRLVRETIVVAVIALSFVLLIGAGVLMQSFSRLRDLDIGFRPDQLLTMRIYLPPAKYSDLAERTRITQQVLDGMRDKPGIDSIALVGGLPLENTMSGDIAFPNEGQFVDARRIASFTEISPGYFRTARIPLIAGRDFHDDDIRNLIPMLEALQANPKATLPPVVINQTMASRFWPGRSAVGQVVLVGGENASRIVGVVGDVKQKDPAEATPPHVYLPMGTPLPPRPAIFMVRSQRAPAEVVAAMREVMAKIDRDVPPYRVRTMSEVMAGAVAGPRFQAVILGVFAVTALLLAVLGIYGVISYSVAQRTREIGIRIATGASRFDVLRLIVGRVGRLAGIGIVFGCTVAIAASQALESLLFEVDAVDPRVFSAVAVLLLATALLASAMPARRAASVDPSISLHES